MKRRIGLQTLKSAAAILTLLTAVSFVCANQVVSTRGHELHPEARAKSTVS